jgi:acetolactate synthase-1/2/3 large subunit
MAPVEPRWSVWRSEARETYLKLREPPPEPEAFVDLARAALHVRERVPHNAIITNGAGNYAIWVSRHFAYREFGSQVAPQAGCMGYGLPAAIAAKLRHPDRMAIAFAGDGCFMMASPDFATAVQYKLPIIVIVANNGLYGSIRMHQERRYPGRPSATTIANPDFAQLARAFGGYGERVERTRDFPAAFDRAIASGLPALLDLNVDPECISPDSTIASIRANASKQTH